ncbi:MAG: MOSC N-terminal beta barrel domain-containing protein [Chloroflexota bacterium]
MNKPKLSNLSFYPIKSMRGHDLEHAQVEKMGLENDRRLMVVDPQGRFITQREHARMALITPFLQGNNLILQSEGMEPLNLEILRSGKRLPVDIWSSKAVESIDQGEKVAKWLSDFLEIPARLVRIADGYQRKISPEYAIQPNDQVGFADGFPLLIISQESLDDLNSRLDNPIPMNRFRTNLVVSGTQPFAEDLWKRIRIGDVELALVKPCARCNVPTINQDTAESSKEPNTTLSKYRKIDGKVMFGMNIIPISTGYLQIGQTVEILE